MFSAQDFLLMFLGCSHDRAMPRSKAPFTMFKSNFSFYSRTSQLGQFLSILCLKIAFLHLKFYTTESSLHLKVLFNGPKWIVEAKNPGLQIYAMRHILYIEILARCVSSKRKPSLQMFAPLMLSRTPGSTGKHLFAKTLTTTKTSICKVIVVWYRVNLSDGICVWNRVFRVVQESLNLSKKRDFIGSQRLFFQTL